MVHFGGRHSARYQSRRLFDPTSIGDPLACFDLAGISKIRGPAHSSQEAAHAASPSFHPPLLLLVPLLSANRFVRAHFPSGQDAIDHAVHRVQRPGVMLQPPTAVKLRIHDCLSSADVWRSPHRLEGRMSAFGARADSVSGRPSLLPRAPLRGQFHESDQ